MVVDSLVPTTTERTSDVSKMNSRILAGILCGILLSVISVFAFYDLSLSGVLAGNWFYGDWLGEHGGLGLILGCATLLILSAVIGYSMAKPHRKVLRAAVLAWILVLGMFITLAFVVS